jgi:diguanylate cyclase (GGDEF)-like protein
VKSPKFGGDVPQGSADDETGLFSFEERLTAEIEAFVAELDSRVKDCEAISDAARALESASPGGGERVAELERLLDEARSEKSAVASSDGLTALSNRQDILKRIKEEKNRTDRTVPAGENGFSLILFDVDGLKAINDSFGLQAGDKVLKRFAAIVKATIRSYDCVGRYGSDEFLILLPGAGKEQAMRVVREAGRKLAAWEGPFKDSAKAPKGSPKGPLLCSAGIAGYASEGKSAAKNVEGIVAQAEYALYRARRKGSGSHAVWGGAKGASDG